MSLGLLSFLFGCAKRESPFSEKEGTWYYRDSQIVGSDARTFQALSDHYAKDRGHVYYGDTYRKGQEYFSVKHSRVDTIPGADPASFVLLDTEYARDAGHIYRDGNVLDVRHAHSFELLTPGLFARDREVGYWNGFQIAGSDGPTFAAVSDYHAKDRASVYYCETDTKGGSQHGVLRVVRLPKADLASFEALESGYARDARQLYYRDRVISDAPAGFEMVSGSYARTRTQVFYDGVVMPGAKPATFKVLVDSVDGVIGTDGTRRYSLGKPIAPSR